VKNATLVRLDDGTRITQVGALFDKLPDTVEEWIGLVEFADHVSTGARWLLADLLAYGQERWPEEYAQALNPLRFTQGYVSNLVWVARHVPWSVRRADLSFSHHQVVAPLPAEQQTMWLEMAADTGMTRDDLRSALQAALTGGKTEEPPTILPSTPGSALRLVLDWLRGSAKMEKEELIKVIETYLKEAKL
jgi:hypothetical protein